MEGCAGGADGPGVAWGLQFYGVCSFTEYPGSRGPASVSLFGVEETLDKAASLGLVSVHETASAPGHTLLSRTVRASLPTGIGRSVVEFTFEVCGRTTARG